MKNNTPHTLTKQEIKQKQKEEKRKNLEKVIESHTLKYYGYFNIVFQMLIFLVLIFSLVFSGVNLLQNKKLYNYIDNNTNIKQASAYSLNDEVTPYDTITDLTGTNWELNDFIYLTSFSIFSINFTSNNILFNTIVFDVEPSIANLLYINNNEEILVNSIGNWSNNAYKTISITGGSDATNSTFISWLQSNATQIQTSLPQLTTPVLSQSMDNHFYTYLTWSSVSNAVSYEIYKDNTLVTTTSSTTYVLPNSSSSLGSYQVKAIADGVIYDNSDLSNVVTISTSQLSAPIISLDNITISWSIVPGALEYEIYKDNVLYDTIQTTSFVVPGAGSYQVKALNNTNSSFIFLNSNLSNSVVYTPTILPTPTIFLVNDTSQPNTFKWQNDISNGYLIFRNGVDITPQFIFGSEGYLYYTVTQTGQYQVQATRTGNPYYSPSALSNTLTFNELFLASPSLSYNNSTRVLSWNIISNASSYEIYKNNSPIAIVDTTNYTLSRPFSGSYNVKAISTGTNYSNSPLSNTINVNLSVLNGSYAFIGSRNYSYNNLPTDVVLDIEFVSNGYNFKSITIDTSTKSILYDLVTPLTINGNIISSLTIWTYDYNIDNLYFAFTYKPQDTAEYLFITIDNYELNIDLYNDYFSNLYRIATIYDYENLGYQNGVIDTNQYTMSHLLFALFDTPIIAMRSLLNFNFFGVNLFAIFTLVITMLVLFAVVKFVKGGKDHEKK